MSLMRLLMFALLTLPLAAETFKLYLTDGGYHLVSEYEVKPDRVRFHSVERGEWEEMPLDLVDLKKTEAERKSREEAIQQETQLLKDEDEAVRAQQREIRSIPEMPGVYVVRNGKPEAITKAEVTVVTPKGRQLLKKISPIPMVSGKSIVEIPGDTAAFVVSDAKQQFYFRLESNDQLALVRVSVKKAKKETTRQVQTYNIAPVINEIQESEEDVEIFTRQVGDDLFQVWPKEPLPPGQYAWIEFTPGKGNTQVWDFAYAP